MNRRSFLLLAPAIVLLVPPLAACGAAPAAAPTGATAGNTYNIGFLVSVTGAAATLGEGQRNVAVMLQQQLDAQGGIAGPTGVRHPVRIIVQDTQGSADTAVTLVKKALGDDNVVAVIGASTSPETMAILPIVQEAKTPLISLAASSAIVEPVAERVWVFKTAASNKHTAPMQVEYVKALGLTRVANIYVNNAYGEDGAKAIREAAAASGIEIVYEDTLEATDTDMTAQIVKIKASGAEAVLVTAINPAAAIFTKQARELGLTLPLVHNHGIGSLAFIELAGAENAEGVVFPMSKIYAASALSADDPQRDVLVQFVADYEASAKVPPSSFAGHAWDALEIVTEALSRVPEGLSLADQRVRLRDEIEATKDLAGIDGVFNFSTEDHVGLSPSDMVLMRINDGKWAYVPREQW